MTFKTTDPRIGLPAITQTDSTAQVGIGTLVRMEDPLYGAGEAIYLPGVASCVTGSLVIYDPQNYTAANPPVLVGSTTLSPNTANLSRPVAVALAAVTSGLFGWYQIEGAATIKKTAVKVNPNVALYQSGTAGRVMSTAASGKQIVGCRSINTATVASATSTILAVINRPHLQGAVA